MLAHRPKAYLIRFALLFGTLSLDPFPAFGQGLDDIILDIYNATSEFAETDYEQLQTDLYALHDAPIDLNRTSDEELSQLYFLSPQQIDELLAYADRHPFVSLYELRLIPSLADYEIRNLLPFVTIKSNDLSGYRDTDQSKLYPKEVFASARHELIARVDARNIEGYEGTDPVYVSTGYRFDYQRRITMGARLRRPAGGEAEALQYGAYIQLRDIAPHLHTVVGGNFQASFGHGLVLAPVFHTGKSRYVSSAGMQNNGLRYYSSVDGQGLHGAGATLRWTWSKQTRLDASVLYSMTRANDSVWHHLVGANLTFRHRLMELQFTAIENLYSDSIHPYYDAAYNARYFRGRSQAVLGASARYNHGWFDAFAEIATAQNRESWGVGIIAGSRFYPASGVTLITLYRYYSPSFDNALGYAFSETSRIGDENGGYLGFDISRLRRWRFTGYGDIFYFSGPKYGLPTAPTLGYDVMTEAQYIRQVWRIGLRLRAKKKDFSLYSARLQAETTHGAWTFRTTADANISHPPSIDNLQSAPPYGLSIAQDISYSLPLRDGREISFRFRLQGFDIREWDNRIYLYEHDVLYSFSVPATYGLGGRAYICLRWQIISQLSLYFKLSETIYDRNWYAQKHPSFQAGDGGILPTRTDIHLLLRAKF